MSEARRRGQEMANELARRAIEAAERAAAEQAGGEKGAERLRRAAAPDGRLSVDEALAALRGEVGESSEPINPLAEEYRAQRDGQAAWVHERLFGQRANDEQED